MDKFQEWCRTCLEIQLWLAIDSFGGSIWWINHDLADRRLKPPDPMKLQSELIELRNQVEFAIDQVTRFGIEHPRINGNATPEYWAWFKSWHCYIKGLLPEEQKQLDDDLEHGGNLSRWYPTRTWRQILEDDRKILFPTKEQIQSHLSIAPNDGTFRCFCSILKNNFFRECDSKATSLNFCTAYSRLNLDVQITKETRSAILTLIDALYLEDKSFAAKVKESLQELLPG